MADLLVCTQLAWPSWLGAWGEPDYAIIGVLERPASPGQQGYLALARQLRQAGGMIFRHHFQALAARR
jgi:hypothetical protein